MRTASTSLPLAADMQEYLAMQKAPPPFIWAVPEEKNILDCEWPLTFLCLPH